VDGKSFWPRVLLDPSPEAKAFVFNEGCKLLERFKGKEELLAGVADGITGNRWIGVASATARARGRRKDAQKRRKKQKRDVLADVRARVSSRARNLAFYSQYRDNMSFALVKQRRLLMWRETWAEGRERPDKPYGHGTATWLFSDEHKSHTYCTHTCSTQK